jgi:HEPN domain-containing protein
VFLTNHIPPKIHNLRQLARHVDPKLQVALEQVDLELLTYWSIESRYPSIHLDINSNDAELAISNAHELFEIIQQHCFEILGRK